MRGQRRTPVPTLSFFLRASLHWKTLLHRAGKQAVISFSDLASSRDKLHLAVPGPVQGLWPHRDLTQRGREVRELAAEQQRL